MRAVHVTTSRIAMTTLTTAKARPGKSAPKRSAIPSRATLAPNHTRPTRLAPKIRTNNGKSGPNAHVIAYSRYWYKKYPNSPDASSRPRKDPPATNAAAASMVGTATNRVKTSQPTPSATTRWALYAYTPLVAIG